MTVLPFSLLTPLLSWAPWAAAGSQWDLGAQTGQEKAPCTGYIVRKEQNMGEDPSKFWSGKFTAAVLTGHFGGFFFPIGDHLFPCAEAPPGCCCWERKLGSGVTSRVP